MTRVPSSAEVHDLGYRRNGTERDAVTLAPGPDVVGAAERQDSCAEMVDAIPSSARRNREMNPQIGLAHPALFDMDVDVLALAADPRVNGGVASHERSDPAGTPHAGRPPSPIAALDPCRGRRGGERMNDPRLADMRMQDHAVCVR